MALSETNHANVLVADCDIATRGLLGQTLQQEGYNAINARSGTDAAKIIGSQTIDLAILNVKLPYVNGINLCRSIKDTPTTRLLPVVLITDFGNTNDRIAAINCGADDYLIQPFHKEELLARVRSLLRFKHLLDELESAESVLINLALSIEAKDPYTVGHCARLSTLSVAVARELGLSEDQCEALKRGAIVHDIGKVAVPDSILLKSGPLSDEEIRLMKEHPVVGERICSPMRSFRSVLPIIRHHHERMNGSGYPDGLKGEAIPITARILATVDVYDALTNDRPYRSSLTPKEAFETMQSEVDKGWLDGMLVAILRKMIAA